MKMLDIIKLNFILFNLFLVVNLSECGKRIVFPDDKILQKSNVTTSTTIKSFHMYRDRTRDNTQFTKVNKLFSNKINEYPKSDSTKMPLNKIEMTTQIYTPPPSTLRPRKYKNCAWCCDNSTVEIDDDTDIDSLANVNFNDLPLCSKCCSFQPQTEEEYAAEPDEDDKLGSISIATILGKK
ncbi:uncharacterized protein LOC129613181 [Condylostylus longicornis]|uniref:uncharacterized protein LOC129613181 n=1 Tax=Condylostylus longicornis TaxID=2530218 RepID=UPI00244DD2FE|nr:uncharacterized protein LOC129613181 [Condylostylus longicornis]